MDVGKPSTGFEKNRWILNAVNQTNDTVYTNGVSNRSNEFCLKDICTTIVEVLFRPSERASRWMFSLISGSYE